MIIETERLIIRPWEDRDRDDLALLHADEQVKHYFPSTLNREESDASFERAQAAFEQNGYHFMATELEETGELVGILGIGKFDAEMTAVVFSHPGVEIGWQFRPKFWGKGLATEGASACLKYGWEKLNLSEIVAVTYKGNFPSQRVMKKIGMTRDFDGDFAHPKVPNGHKLRPHVLYRITNPAQEHVADK